MRIIYGLSAIAAIAWVSLAVAQNREPARPAAPGARPAAAAPAAGVRPAAAAPVQVAWTADQQIAALLYNCCRNEVEISKFAQDKLQSNEAQKFAERMVAEHEAACQKLAKFAGPALEGSTRLDVIPGRPARVEGRTEAREERREGREEAREARREEGAPEAREERREGRAEAREEVREGRAEARDADPAAEAPRPARPARPGQAEIELKVGGDRPSSEVEVRLERAGGAGGLNWVSIHKQIADQCLASTKQEFATKEGPELDRCFIGGQIMGHMKALDEIKVLRNYASAELRAELDECSQHCAEHLKEAKALAQKLEGETPRVSRKPEGADEATKPE
jgi:predicted outer membrane protein